VRCAREAGAVASAAAGELGPGAAERPRGRRSGWGQAGERPAAVRQAVWRAAAVPPSPRRAGS